MEMYEVPQSGDDHIYESGDLDIMETPQEATIAPKTGNNQTKGCGKKVIILFCSLIVVVAFASIATLAYFLHIYMEKAAACHYAGHSNNGTVIIDNTKNDPCYSDGNCLNGGTCVPANQPKGHRFKCQCVDGYLGKTCEYSDGRFTDFLVIFQTIYTAVFKPRILIPVNAKAEISIHSFSSNKNTSTIITNGHLEHSLGSVQTEHNGLHQAGFEIISNIPITLYTILYTNDPDGYLAIPIKYASTQYIIASFEVKNRKSVFSMSPIHSRTVVNINLKLESGSITYEGQQYCNNDNLTIVFNKYSVFELSHNSDLSGTMLRASRPIVVVSGNTYNTINGISGNNPFIEMILPVNQLDVLYIIPHIAKRENSTVRLIAIQDTNVTKQTGNHYSHETLKSRVYLDFFHNSISFVRSSNPIMVQIYPHELPSSQGDAFMMTIPGVNQYLNEYLFMAPSHYISNISVTVETNGLDGFVLDGQYLTVLAVFSISGEDKKFSSFTLPISSGTHHLTHSRKVRFGLWVYGTGISSTDDSYGYPAGIAFKTI